MKKILKTLLISTLFLSQSSFAQIVNDGSDIFSKPQSSSRLSSLFSSSKENNILSPEKAFRFQSQINEKSVNFLFDITQGHYIYRDKLEFRLDNEKIQNINEVVKFPESILVADPTFGNQYVFKGQIDIAVLRDRLHEINHNAKEVSLTYYGCSPEGICYTPEVKTISLENKSNSQLNSNQLASHFGTIVFFIIGFIILFLGVVFHLTTPKKDEKNNET